MKVYSCPKEVELPERDYSKPYDSKTEMEREEKHKAELKNWLIKSGYTGKRTGEIVRFGVADGYAQYMLADGSKSCLIHLPYGDAYNYRDVGFLPKKEILKRIDADKNLAKLFALK